MRCASEGREEGSSSAPTGMVRAVSQAAISAHRLLTFSLAAIWLANARLSILLGLARVAAAVPKRFMGGLLVHRVQRWSPSHERTVSSPTTSRRLSADNNWNQFLYSSFPCQFLSAPFTQKMSTPGRCRAYSVIKSRRTPAVAVLRFPRSNSLDRWSHRAPPFGELNNEDIQKRDADLRIP